jgi:hypothetical protein
MGKPSMAIPTRPFLVNHTYRCFMATDAVRQQDLFPVLCDLYPLGCQTGKKESYVFYPVNRFPDIVEGHILVRQVTVNAFISSVSTCVCKCLKFLFHHVAASAEDRGLGPCQKLWRTKQQEKNYHSSDHDQNDKIPNNFFGLSVIHIFTPF